uniref:Septin-type G domain-containing protein n=1 Tax=Amphiprion percula TaxID=161767 RepID=A0A3P8S7F8_AMPPE
MSTRRLPETVRRTSERMNSDSPSVYKLKLEEEEVCTDGCRKFNFGKESRRENRTIIVSGGTGSGKSTLINGMINYILGVQWEDSYRFKLVDEDQWRSQSHSQTSEVTVYKINHQEGFEIDYSLTIVDAPGFGDTRGTERDREIVEQLRNLFSDHRGVTEIDAVCFVVQSALARLTPSQKYVFDSVLSIFGKDVAENIRILVTFADGQQPPVLEAIKASGVPCPKTDDGLPVHFTFNNSALFADNKSSVTNNTGDDEDGGFDQMVWNMGTKSMKRFFDALNVIQTKSLKLTKEVLRERRQLEDTVEDLQKKVKLVLAKMEEIKQTSKKLKDHEAEMKRNENFEIEITVTKPYQHDISGSGNYTTNCQVCHYTCHYPCRRADDKDKIHCSAMKNGFCTQCPNKCQWNVHFSQKYRWEYKEVKEKQPLQQLKEKYLKATGEKTTVQGVIDKLKAEYDRLHAVVLKLIEKSSKCLNRLREISLKPNPLSTPDYIDLLIEGEKSEGKPGWKERVESLMDMKQKAELMVKVEKREKFL